MADVAHIPNAHQWYDSVPRSIRWHAIFGLTLMVVAFGSFGVWAFRAPLAAAVIAQGSFVATGQNKIVQHLEGGIISQILVREGDSVAAGAPILKLDETLAEATKRELTIRQARLEATEARLMAQHLDQDRLVYDDALESQRGDPEVATILESQKLAFSVARSGLHNDIALIERNMDALVARQRGYVLQRQSLEAQLQIVLDDLKIKDSLLEGGMVARDKVTMLRRAELEATGQLARIEAEILEIDEMRQKFQTQIDKTRDEYRRRWQSFRRSRQRRKASANRSARPRTCSTGPRSWRRSRAPSSGYTTTLRAGSSKPAAPSPRSCPTMRP